VNRIYVGTLPDDKTLTQKILGLVDQNSIKLNPGHVFKSDDEFQEKGYKLVEFMTSYKSIVEKTDESVEALKEKFADLGSSLIEFMILQINNTADIIMTQLADPMRDADDRFREFEEKFKDLLLALNSIEEADKKASKRKGKKKNLWSHVDTRSTKTRHK
jgi:hypothetical protein